MKEALKLALEALEEYDAGLLNDYGGGNVEWWQDYIRAELGRAYEHYQSQTTAPVPEQPEQEPVKYEFQSTHDGKWYAFHDDKHYADDLADGRWPIRALYTAPPQRPWVGLTDEENLICLGFNKVLGLQYQEAKLKEKNNGN